MIPRTAFALLFLALGAAAAAQQPAAQKDTSDPGPRRIQVPPEVRARMDSARVRNFPPGTAEGLSNEEYAAYTRTIEQYWPKPGSFFDFSKALPAEERDRLLALFSRMNRAQQLRQQVVFRKPDAPKPDAAPSEADFAAFRDSTRYTVLIDYRPVPNSALDRYKASDFAWHRVNESQVKQAGSAYFTQRVDLETNVNHRSMVEQYARFKDTYQMVYTNSVPRTERSERPSY